MGASYLDTLIRQITHDLKAERLRKAEGFHLCSLGYSYVTDWL